MKAKIPELEKCCFCIPLRLGLVVWGYFKMIVDAFVITFLSISMIQVVMSAKVLSLDDDIQTMISYELTIPCAAFAVFIVDFLGTLVFVFGGLEKNVKLTQVFYFISIAMLIFSLLVTATFIVITMHTGMDFTAFLFYFLNLVVQIYFLILLRSEIIKLKNTDESGSQNKAVEAESTAKCEEIAGEEARKEVV